MIDGENIGENHLDTCQFLLFFPIFSFSLKMLSNMLEIV